MYLGSEEILLLQMGSVPSQRTWESRRPLFHHCEWVSSFSIALIEHHEQKGLGGGKFISVYSPTSQFIIGGIQGRQRPKRGREGVFPPGLLHSVFLYTPGPLSQGGHCSRWAGLSHISHHSRECPYQPVTQRLFSFKIPSSQMATSCVRLT